MEKIRKFFTSVPGIILVFILAAIPFLIGGIGSARAALTYYSDTYKAEVSMKRIGVTLYDNGQPAQKISNRDYVGNGEWDENTGYLLANTFVDDNGQPEMPKFGKEYKKKLSVLNSGSIDSYVRVTIYKYWYTLNDKGEEVKDYSMSPELVKINVLPGNGWVLDDSSQTTERTVLYYDRLLPSGQQTPDFTDYIKIDGDIKGNVVITTDEKGNTTATYKYNDHYFLIQVDVDAVQDHNAIPAIKSAWGWDVTLDNGILKKIGK